MNRRQIVGAVDRRHAVVAASLLLAVALVAVWLNPALLITGYDRATVEIVDAESGDAAATDAEPEVLATVDARVADTFLKRYVGLSATESLDPDEGMLFVHDEPGEYGYVMRDMAFAIDILFIRSDGTITEIHSAEPEEPPYTRYAGEGQYVLEVRYGYAADHGIEVGDRVRFTWETTV